MFWERIITTLRGWATAVGRTVAGLFQRGAPAPTVEQAIQETLETWVWGSPRQKTENMFLFEVVLRDQETGTTRTAVWALPTDEPYSWEEATAYAEEATGYMGTATEAIAQVAPLMWIKRKPAE